MTEMSLFASRKEDSPMARLFELTMRGNGEVASQQQKKQAAADKDALNAKTSITIQGDGRITVKNADPALLEGTQGQEIAEAGDAPKRAVDAALATKPEDDPLGPAYDATSAAVGRRIPRASDRDIDEKLQSDDGIRDLTLEMGGTRKDAAAAIRALKEGRITRSGMRDRVAAYRLRNLQAIQKTLQGPLDEAQDIAKRATDERKATTTEQRTAAKERLDRLTKIINETDLADTPEAEWSSTIESSFGEPVTAFERSRIMQKGRRDVAKALDAFINKDADALGQFGSVDEAKAAFGRTVTPEQEKRLGANWKAARSKVIAAERAAASQDEREARAARNEVRMMLSSERAARTEARMERTEQRQLTNAEKSERKDRINSVLKSIDENNKEIIKNARDITKAINEGKNKADKEVAFLLNRQAALKASNSDLADQLPQYGVTLRKTKGKQQEFVSQAEWDALIKSGETPQSLAADRIVLRKK